jgi:hypothetical protein
MVCDGRSTADSKQTHFGSFGGPVLRRELGPKLCVPTLSNGVALFGDAP